VSTITTGVPCPSAPRQLTSPGKKGNASTAAQLASLTPENELKVEDDTAYAEVCYHVIDVVDNLSYGWEHTPNFQAETCGPHGRFTN
jgi:hypothetical protein